VGQLKIGMTVAEAEQALGRRIVGWDYRVNGCGSALLEGSTT